MTPPELTELLGLPSHCRLIHVRADSGDGRLLNPTLKWDIIAA
jgi:hypothetical protein